MLLHAEDTELHGENRPLFESLCLLCGPLCQD